MRPVAAALIALGLLACARRDRAQPAEDRIIAFGDSLTAGYGVSRSESYPGQLERLLGRRVTNRGVSGNTTAEGLARLQRDVLDAKPRVVLVCLGTNDMLRSLPAEEQFSNLRAMVDAIKAGGAQVILIGTEGYRGDQAVDYSARYRLLAAETGAVYVPDLMQGVLRDPSLMLDRIHPNAAGYEKIARRLLSEVGDHLRR